MQRPAFPHAQHPSQGWHTQLHLVPHPSTPHSPPPSTFTRALWPAREAPGGLSHWPAEGPRCTDTTLLRPAPQGHCDLRFVVCFYSKRRTCLESLFVRMPKMVTETKKSFKKSNKTLPYIHFVPITPLLREAGITCHKRDKDKHGK